MIDALCGQIFISREESMRWVDITWWCLRTMLLGLGRRFKFSWVTWSSMTRMYSLTWNICCTFFKLSSEARGMARLIWGYINSMASHVHWFTHALEGQDIIAISATGSGKSAYYIYMLAIVLVALGKRPVVRVVFWLVCPTTVLKEDLVTYVHDLYHYQSGYIIHSVGSQNENIQSQG